MRGHRAFHGGRAMPPLEDSLPPMQTPSGLISAVRSSSERPAGSTGLLSGSQPIVPRAGPDRGAGEGMSLLSSLHPVADRSWHVSTSEGFS